MHVLAARMVRCKMLQKNLYVENFGPRHTYIINTLGFQKEKYLYFTKFNIITGITSASLFPITSPSMSLINVFLGIKLEFPENLLNASLMRSSSSLLTTEDTD